MSESEDAMSVMFGADEKAVEPESGTVGEDERERDWGCHSARDPAFPFSAGGWSRPRFGVIGVVRL